MPDLVLKLTDEQMAELAAEAAAAGLTVEEWAAGVLGDQVLDARVLSERARLQAEASVEAAAFAETKLAEAEAAAQAFEDALRGKLGKAAAGAAAVEVSDGLSG